MEATDENIAQYRLLRSRLRIFSAAGSFLGSERTSANSQILAQVSELQLELMAYPDAWVELYDPQPLAPQAV